MQQTLSRRRPSKAERQVHADLARFAARRAACPRTSQVLDAAWSRMDRELDEKVRAGLSDLLFTLGIYQDTLRELTQEEADQAYIFLVGDLS